MAKYTSDTNLIRGAAAAYKDWSNMPGMYEGLDKLSAAGKKAVDDGIKERNDTIDKINNAAEEALVRGGGLGKNHYDYSFDLVNKFKRDYWEGVKSKDEKKKMDALMLLNNHVEEVADLKALNADYSKLHVDGDLTSAMNEEKYETSRGVYTSRNKVLTNMLNNNYTVSQNKEGQRVYTMDIDGTKHSITKYQYERLTGLKNYEFGNTFDKQVQRGYQSPITNLESFESNILKSLPDDEFGMEGIIADGLRGEHLEGLVRKYITPNMVAQKAFGKIFDTDKSGLSDNYISDNYISDDEYENFIDAILNFSGPNKNDFGDVGNTKKIIAEVAALHGKELNDLHWAAKRRSRQQISTTPGDENPFGKGMVVPGFTSAGWQTGTTLLNRRNLALDLKDFTGLAGDYSYDTKLKKWILNDDTENPIAMSKVLQTEGLLLSTDAGTQFDTDEQIEESRVLTPEGKEELKKELKPIFMGTAANAVDKIKSILPEGYDVITSRSFMGKKGDTPFFRDEDKITIYGGGKELGTFNVNYSKEPTKAEDELLKFIKELDTHLRAPITKATTTTGQNPFGG